MSADARVYVISGGGSDWGEISRRESAGQLTLSWMHTRPLLPNPFSSSGLEEASVLAVSAESRGSGGDHCVMSQRGLMPVPDYQHEQSGPYCHSIL